MQCVCYCNAGKEFLNTNYMNFSFKVNIQNQYLGQNYFKIVYSPKYFSPITVSFQILSSATCLTL